MCRCECVCVCKCVCARFILVVIIRFSCKTQKERSFSSLVYFVRFRKVAKGLTVLLLLLLLLLGPLRIPLRFLGSTQKHLKTFAGQSIAAQNIMYINVESSSSTQGKLEA